VDVVQGVTGSRRLIPLVSFSVISQTEYRIWGLNSIRTKRRRKNRVQGKGGNCILLHESINEYLLAPSFHLFKPTT
jgi:hypothetical protein